MFAANRFRIRKKARTRVTEKLLLRFPPSDCRFGVTRMTVTRLAEQLRLTETAVIHYALNRLAAELLPTSERDDGPLTAQELRTISRLAGGHRGKSVRSSLF